MESSNALADMSASASTDINEELAGLALSTQRDELKAAECEVMVARCRLVYAKLTLQLAAARGKLAALQELHEDCSNTGANGGAAPAPPPAKKQKAEPQMPPDDGVEVQQLETILAKAKRVNERLQASNDEIQAFDKKVVQRDKEIKDTELQLADLQSAHRACEVVSQFPGVAKWEEETMHLSGSVLFNKTQREAFLTKLTAAPCLKSLDLRLKERFGRSRKRIPEMLPTLICIKAPARIKELTLEFGFSSKEAILSLLEKTCDYLEKLEVRPGYQCEVDYTDEDLCRFWGILERSTIKSLSVYTDKIMRRVQFPFQADKWCHLEKLKYAALAPKHRTLLASLIRANSANLRVVELPANLSLREEERVPIFEALAKCANIEEMTLDCVEEITLLQECAKLKSLDIFNVGGILSNSDADTKAVGHFLRLPSSIERIEKLSFNTFQSRKAILHVFSALASLKNLKCLHVNVCADFPEMKKTLQALTSLEELHLMQGSFVNPKRIAEISPEVLPKLKLLKLRSEKKGTIQWEKQVQGIKKAFQRVNPNFNLCDESHGPSAESNDEESSDEGLSVDLESDTDDSESSPESDDSESESKQQGDCVIS